MLKTGECSIVGNASVNDSGVFGGRYGTYAACGPASDSIETASSSIVLVSYSFTTSRCSGSGV